MSRTIRSSRTKTAMLVSAGTVAALLSVVPSTAAAADTLPASTAELPGSSALVMSFDDDDDRRGERGERGERGPQGPPGPQGPEGELDTYVVTGPVATSDVIGTDVTSTALCLGNDIAIGGGYDTTDLLSIDVEDSVPVFVGTGPATGWRATASVLALGGSVTAFAVCHDVE
ncbi:hypothetical protein ACIOWI_14760 [Streptomyces sp. NPDC087659]|uniref:hypothetical protein n=1 Tax=Streptomyces sp. NPDC087659 TaxID=3365801 RepID=UPI00382EDB0C